MREVDDGHGRVDFCCKVTDLNSNVSVVDRGSLGMSGKLGEGGRCGGSMVWHRAARGRETEPRARKCRLKPLGTDRELTWFASFKPPVRAANQLSPPTPCAAQRTVDGEPNLVALEAVLEHLAAVTDERRRGKELLDELHEQVCPDARLVRERERFGEVLHDAENKEVAVCSKRHVSDTERKGCHDEHTEFEARGALDV